MLKLTDAQHILFSVLQNVCLEMDHLGNAFLTLARYEASSGFSPVLKLLVLVHSCSGTEGTACVIIRMEKQVPTV